MLRSGPIAVGSRQEAWLPHSDHLSGQPHTLAAAAKARALTAQRASPDQPQPRWKAQRSWLPGSSSRSCTALQGTSVWASSPGTCPMAPCMHMHEVIYLM